MNVIHTGMVYTDGTRTVYSAQIVSCRWRDRARGKWSGRHVADTGARFEHVSDGIHGDDARAKCDELARSEARRLGLPAGPDTFPFSY